MTILVRFRYPRGAFLVEDRDSCGSFELGKSELLQRGYRDTLFIGYGNGVGRAETDCYIDGCRISQYCWIYVLSNHLDEEMLTDI